MKFTAQEEYGLRCVLTLARIEAETGRADDDGLSVTVAEIAEREGLTVQNAGKLIRILGKAGLLESVRGCKGGYRLARPAAEITVGQILAVLGGALYEPHTCDRYTGSHELCVHRSDCSIRSLWSGLHSVVDRVLSRVTLADLLADEHDTLRGVMVHVEDIGVLTSSTDSGGGER